MTAIHAKTALLADGWAEDVTVRVQDGAIAAIERDAAADADGERVAILVPAMPNVHSHAFQRGMAGLAERRGPADDDFWTWREVMYRFALGLTPDEMEAVAAQLYVEMLEAGFGRIGEFHYLHHDRDGRPYARLSEMGERVAAAAAETGISLTLLPVLYAHSDFGGAPAGNGQRRFLNDADSFARIVEESSQAVAPLRDPVIGVAPHSLRAVTPAELEAAVALSARGPIHIHAAEQVKEVDACLAWSGKRPVEWLLDHAGIDARWCLIHSTHMTDNETERLARSGAVAGLCPVTEANLGDGTFQGVKFRRAGGLFGIGSDSNILIGVADELRQLEYAQRLLHRRRNVLATPGQSNGRALFDGAIAGGNRALGGRPMGLAAGNAASFVALDAAAPTMAGKAGDDILDAWLFAGGTRPDAVWIGGEKVVSGGRHVRRDAVQARFIRTMRALAERL
jgi:formimidoylglutamate deiminase